MQKFFKNLNKKFCHLERLFFLSKNHQTSYQEFFGTETNWEELMIKFLTKMLGKPLRKMQIFQLC